jgi:hypothetical protein
MRKVSTGTRIPARSLCVKPPPSARVLEENAFDSEMPRQRRVDPEAPRIGCDQRAELACSMMAQSPLPFSPFKNLGSILFFGFGETYLC